MDDYVEKSRRRGGARRGSTGKGAWCALGAATVVAVPLAWGAGTAVAADGAAASQETGLIAAEGTVTEHAREASPPTGVSAPAGPQVGPEADDGYGYEPSDGGGSQDAASAATGGYHGYGGYGGYTEEGVLPETVEDSLPGEAGPVHEEPHPLPEPGGVTPPHEEDPLPDEGPVPGGAELPEEATAPQEEHLPLPEPAGVTPPRPDGADSAPDEDGSDTPPAPVGQTPAPGAPEPPSPPPSGGDGAPVKETAQGHSARPSQPELAVTGMVAAVPALAGLASVSAGAMALFLGRRRRSERD
ncbi:hypothetical protein ABZ635_18040 [Nocardiopsis sp. NPDC007018]|uniref:hypothetical protein n=1 Tax=Nocardiopsis sp. NPDC007018 TaxID=3155721 RepID=UPI00340728AD